MSIDYREAQSDPLTRDCDSLLTAKLAKVPEAAAELQVRTCVSLLRSDAPAGLLACSFASRFVALKKTAKVLLRFGFVVFAEQKRRNRA